MDQQLVVQYSIVPAVEPATTPERWKADLQCLAGGHSAPSPSSCIDICAALDENGADVNAPREQRLYGRNPSLGAQARANGAARDDLDVVSV